MEFAYRVLLLKSLAVTLVLDIVLFAESYDGGMDLITYVPSIKTKPETYEEDVGEILHGEIDIDCPDINEEYLAEHYDTNRTAECGAPSEIDSPDIKKKCSVNLKDCFVRLKRIDQGSVSIIRADPVDVHLPSTGSAGSALIMDTATMSETLAKEGGSATLHNTPKTNNEYECGALSEIDNPDIKKKSSIYLKNCFVYLERIDQGSGVEPEITLTFKEDGRPLRNIHPNLTPQLSRSKSLPSQKMLSCPYCSYSCSCNSFLKRHIRTHTGEKPYTCSECGNSFSLKSALRSHIFTHRKDKLFKCSKCDYSCCQSTQFRYHVLTHGGAKPFVCSKCNFSSLYKNCLTRHLLTHSGVKPFSCSECNRSFLLKSYLKGHYRIHSGEKPFACSDCNYICMTSSGLRKHNLTHSKIKPFSCALCNYSCSQKCSLKYHLYTHSKIKPFSCAHCNYSGSFRSNLKRHLMTHNIQNSA